MRSNHSNTHTPMHTHTNRLGLRETALAAGNVGEGRECIVLQHIHTLVVCAQVVDGLGGSRGMRTVVGFKPAEPMSYRPARHTLPNTADQNSLQMCLTISSSSRKRGRPEVSLMAVVVGGSGGLRGAAPSFPVPAPRAYSSKKDWPTLTPSSSWRLYAVSWDAGVAAAIHFGEEGAEMMSNQG